MKQEEMLNAKVSEVLPKDFELHEELGKGSNNKVFRVTWNGDEVILRTPRRQSDTQQRGSAKWEYLHTFCASRCFCHFCQTIIGICHLVLQRTTPL